MQNQSWFFCTDCYGTNMVYDRDGDYVCKNCGLVKCGHIIDETPERGFFPIEDDPRFDPVQSKDTRFDRYLNHLDDTLRKIILEIFDCYIEHKKDGKTYEKQNNCILANATFYASRYLKRPLPKDDICRMFQISLKQFGKHLWDILESIRTQRYYDDILKELHTNIPIQRAIYNLGSYIALSSDETWKLIKTAFSLYDNIKDNPCVAALKQDKLCSTIVYISCKIRNHSIKVGTFCKGYNTTIVTLRNHEAIIQTALQKNSVS